MPCNKNTCMLVKQQIRDNMCILECGAYCIIYFFKNQQASWPPVWGRLASVEPTGAVRTKYVCMHVQLYACNACM